MRNAFFLTVLVSLFACSAAPAQQATDPAARVGNRTITTKELDDRWRADDPASQAEATQKLYDGRRAALDAIIAEQLLAEAGKKKGMTAAAYELEEVGKRIKPVGDSEVVAFYQANINQMQGRSLEVMSPAINRFLTDQQRDTARNALIAELRKAGPEVRVLIDAPRREVELESSDPSLGRASAPVTLIEFSDFQCPFCQRVEPTLKRLRDTYGDKLRIVFRQFLLSFHQQAQKAAEASLCAGDQGKFWELHDAMFADQQALGVDQLKTKAAGLGINAEQFNQCLDSGKHAATVQADLKAGSEAGVSGTPAMFINGRFVNGAVPLEQVTPIIDDELRRAGQKTAAKSGM